MELGALGRRSRVPSQTDSGASDVALNVPSRAQSSQIGDQVGDHFVRPNPTIPVPVPAVPAGGWRSYVFIIPIVSAAIASVGAAFSIRNWAYLDASKTLNFVKTLSPVLTQAHAQIYDKLSEIADILRNQTDKG